jgi:hypothetical protein
LDEVVQEVLRTKIERALGKRQPIRPEAVAMWNELAETTPR